MPFTPHEKRRAVVQNGTVEEADWIATESLGVVEHPRKGAMMLSIVLRLVGCHKCPFLPTT